MTEKQILEKLAIYKEVFIKLIKKLKSLENKHNKLHNDFNKQKEVNKNLSIKNNDLLELNNKLAKNNKELLNKSNELLKLNEQLQEQLKINDKNQLAIALDNKLAVANKELELYKNKCFAFEKEKNELLQKCDKLQNELKQKPIATRKAKAPIKKTAEKLFGNENNFMLDLKKMLIRWIYRHNMSINEIEAAYSLRASIGNIQQAIKEIVNDNDLEIVNGYIKIPYGSPNDAIENLKL